MEIKGSDREFTLVGQGSIFDGIAYWLILAGIYLMVGGLMFYSGWDKLFEGDREAPAGIEEQFANSFLSTFPGTDTAWFVLGVFEFAVFLLLVASIVRLEFLPHRDKSILQVGLALALLTFACMAFGQTATGQHEGTASLYTYFGSTAVILLIVRLLPPHRPDRWLAGAGSD
jgi:hypothetical protein